MASPRVFFIDFWRAQEQRNSAFRLGSRLAIVFICHFTAGELGLAVPFTSSNVSPVWPAAGVAVAAVLIWGVEVAPAIATAAFLLNFLHAIPFLPALGMGIANMSSALLAGYLLARLFDFKPSLASLKDVLRFVLISALVAPTVAAFLGLASLSLAHKSAWSGFAAAWRIWWIGDAMGVLVVAPLLLAWRDLTQRCRGWGLFELSVLSLFVLASSCLVFGPWVAFRDDVLAFVVFPFVIWAAIRFRVAGAAISSVLLSAVAVWGTAHGFGPFVNHSALRNAELLQMYIAVTALTGLILSAVINEREQIAKADALKEKLLIGVEAEKEALEAKVFERTRQLEEKTAKLSQQARLLDLANDGIFVRDAVGNISYWNEGAERLYGWTAEETLGRSTHELLKTEFPIDLKVIQASDRWSGELKHCCKDGSQITVESRWTKVRDADGRVLGWLEVNTDISARKQAEEAARSLAGRILTLQDDEHRKIARELHDSLGQYLAALKMSLDLISRKNSNLPLLVAECSEIVEKCLSETRTISHLLHPPLLDEAGFSSAARWYVDGFAKRSGVQVNLHLPPQCPRMHKDIEVALFRALQEGLTNIHKHSGATSVEIRLSQQDEMVRLNIQDNGCGMPKPRLGTVKGGNRKFGVGIAGMRERVRELGGSLQIRSDATGTTLIVTLPFSGSHPEQAG